jgi:hypothetical protein
MSMVSTPLTPPASQEQEPAPVPTLSMEADPSGFTERAPALLSLLPDEALTLALARADGLAVHAALRARLERESSGAARDTVQELLSNRALFVMAERPPRLSSFLGSGVALVGLPAPEQQPASFIATRALCVFGVPVWSLGEHLVSRGRDGQLEILGRVASMPTVKSARRWKGRLILGGVGLAAAGLALMPFVTREVQLVNGLSRPVEVRVDDRTVTLKPGEMAQEELFSLGSPYQVEARWPGSQEPFEVLSLEASQRAVYNVLGAASLKVENPAQSALPPLEGRAASLESDEKVLWQGGWESKVRELAQARHASEAANLAKAVFLADPSALQAGEQAGLILARQQPREAFGFAAELQRKFPEDPAVQRLAYEVFIASGMRSEAFTRYSAWAKEVPTSLPRALWAARFALPDEQRQLYARLQERFPNAPEPVRALARLRLADGFPKEALTMLDTALAKGPESLEDVALHVRALVSLKQWREASGVVHQFAADPKHLSWELAVLGGRLARLVGPTRTQYVTHDLIPPALTGSAERMAAFTLLTGDGTVTDKELKGILDPEAREAIELTRTVFKDWEQAVQKAIAAPEPVLRRLDLETAALLALELSRRGEGEAAERLFGSSLSLMAVREPLETYMRLGVARVHFPLLPPGLQAAAYLVRANAMTGSRFTEQSYARATDVLSGMARRALDASYEEPAPQPQSPSSYQSWGHHHHHIEIIQIIKGTPAEPPPPPPPPPEERSPRPWSAQ